MGPGLSTPPAASGRSVAGAYERNHSPVYTCQKKTMSAKRFIQKSQRCAEHVLSRHSKCPAGQ